MIFDNARSEDKEMKVINGAGHYYKEQPEKLSEAVAIIMDWLERHRLK